MYRKQGLLALLALYVGLVQSFSWDIVVARSNRLEFYNEGILAHTATPASHRIKWITYDAVHDRVLFAEKYNREDSASSFDIANKTTQSLIKKKPNRYLTRFAYDPATELLFGTVTKSIYSFPLGPGNNNKVNGDLVITLEAIPSEVAVDSCGGYVYWTTNNIIERALFNGSEREVIIDNMSNTTVRQGLTVDSQKIYWIETEEYNDGSFSIESADLDGNNRKTLHSETESDWLPDKLTLSKDFISWGDSIEKFFWQLPKNPSNGTHVKPNKIAMNTTISSCGSHDIAANYKIEERTRRIPNCHALLSLIPDVCLKASEFCVHGTKAVWQPRCECLEGYIGERCDVSVCENYCFQGECRIDAEGQPQCRCNAGYTGGRCDVSVCENYCFHGNCNVSAEGQPTCRCNSGFTGERCDTAVCENYCLQGDCDVSVEGKPKCRCNAGYSGNRCDVKTCYNHCLNDGICSLNEENEPVCQCTGQYEGERCDVKTVSLHWLPMVDGELPPGAIIGGFESEHTYIARANHSGSLCPGKYIKETDTASVPWGGLEHVNKHFEILCGFNAKWVKTENDNIPANAYVGGRTGGAKEVDGEPLYICRDKINSKLISGKAYARTKLCYLPYNGEEKQTTSYEILVED